MLLGHQTEKETKITKTDSRNTLKWKESEKKNDKLIINNNHLAVGAAVSTAALQRLSLNPGWVLS